MKVFMQFISYLTKCSLLSGENIFEIVHPEPHISTRELRANNRYVAFSLSSRHYICLSQCVAEPLLSLLWLKLLLKNLNTFCKSVSCVPSSSDSDMSGTGICLFFFQCYQEHNKLGRSIPPV